MSIEHSTGNATLSSMHILIVDDDEFLLELMTEMISQRGITSIQIANNGLKALQLYRNSTPQPNLIICDLCMPELGGMELLNHLAKDGCKADVLIMSGHNLIPPENMYWTMSNYNGPVLNLAEKLAKNQGLNVRATFEKPITSEKIEAMFAIIDQARMSN